MRVLTCGGRTFGIEIQEEKELLESVLERALHKCNVVGQQLVIINGCAKGADEIALKWSKRRHLVNETYFADWENEGRRAGPIRNQKMIDSGKPDVVLAFGGGRGTEDMVNRAVHANIPVYHYRIEFK